MQSVAPKEALISDFSNMVVNKKMIIPITKNNDNGKRISVTFTIVAFRAYKNNEGNALTTNTVYIDRIISLNETSL